MRMLVLGLAACLAQGWSVWASSPAHGGAAGLFERVGYRGAAPEPPDAPEGAPVRAGAGGADNDAAGQRPERPVGSVWEELPSPAELGSLCRRYSCYTRSAGMAIDTDGWIKDPALRERIVGDDPWHQDETSYRYADGEGTSLDPTVVRYVVIPKSGFPQAEAGDLAVVEYGGRRLAAVVGDLGPARKFGEGSWRLATDFGIPNSGRTGGVDSGVTYTFLGGSSAGRASSEGELLRQLQALQRQI